MISCPRCHRVRIDGRGVCACCGFVYQVHGGEVVALTGTPNAQSAGSTPAAPANLDKRAVSLPVARV
jgi:hypothetical protein